MSSFTHVFSNPFSYECFPLLTIWVVCGQVCVRMCSLTNVFSNTFSRSATPPSYSRWARYCVLECVLLQMCSLTQLLDANTSMSKIFDKKLSFMSYYLDFRLGTCVRVCFLTIVFSLSTSKRQRRTTPDALLLWQLLASEQAAIRRAQTSSRTPTRHAQHGHPELGMLIDLRHTLDTP